MHNRGNPLPAEKRDFILSVDLPLSLCQRKRLLFLQITAVRDVSQNETR